MIHFGNPLPLTHSVLNFLKHKTHKFRTGSAISFSMLMLNIYSFSYWRVITDDNYVYSFHMLKCHRNPFLKKIKLIIMLTTVEK